ncbi:glycoside hydrolase TIM-barrel-like domain-containing protein [Holosporaceae bacterium 'Namur']|nr:glycoside hydrolase TIM-barrel-like domain-containing protein [Holosporaceae bacterium 'Namur']
MTKHLNEKITSLVISPGSGEFIYSPLVIYDKYNTQLNASSNSPKSNILLTIEQLKHDFPNLKNISLLVGWFANKVEANNISIKPKVETRTAVQGEDWQVANYTRNTAKLVSQVNGKPNWGGTPNDKSIVEVCELLKANGFNITLYPILFVDQPAKPWRGFIHAESDQEIEHFFNEYAKFIIHYTTLEYESKKLKDYISNFIIGSEFRDLLKYKNSNNEFIAVDKLIILTNKVKSELGEKIKLTYAANWDEYHHTDNGWHHLDSLWASDNIDYIGINAYFPLTDNLPQKNISYDIIKEGWQSGEYYDYIKDKNGKQIPIEPKWAIKNIEYWWKNYHYNPDGKVTKWRPKLKPIIFTEIGFPSIDGCTNQPNLYIDITTNNTKLPPNSKGLVDYKAQQIALEATLDYWQDKELIQGNRELIGGKGAFVYSIDARYDFYKQPKNYADVKNYKYGHWIKLNDTTDLNESSFSLAISSLIVVLICFIIIAYKTR